MRGQAPASWGNMIAGLEVGEDSEARADAEEARLGPLGPGEIVPLGAAHRTEEDGLAPLADRQRLGRQGLAELVYRSAAHRGLRKGELEGEAPGDGLEDLDGRLDNVRPDSVARNRCDVVILASVSPIEPHM